jgi:hypothetical protein
MTVIVIDSDLFTCGVQDNKVVLSADISSIDHLYTVTHLHGGFGIKSQKTGQIVHFKMFKVDTCGEDTAGWWFQPVPEDVNKLSCPVEVLIIND